MTIERIAESSTQNVNLWNIDKQIVRDYANQHSLSFSAALRFIIREWHAQRLTPAQQVVEELRGEM